MNLDQLKTLAESKGQQFRITPSFLGDPREYTFKLLTRNLNMEFTHTEDVEKILTNETLSEDSTSERLTILNDALFMDYYLYNRPKYRVDRRSRGTNFLITGEDEDGNTTIIARVLKFQQAELILNATWNSPTQHYEIESPDRPGYPISRSPIRHPNHNQTGTTSRNNTIENEFFNRT